MIAASLWTRLDVRSTLSRASRSSLPALRAIALLVASLCLVACIYRIDVQQGNLLKDSDIARVQVGMTRSQVQFLLGTPMVADSFHRNRWDYAYYLRKGRSPDIQRRWVVVFFE